KRLEELPGGLSEEIHRAYAAAPGEIEGGQGERRPEALSAALRRHGDRAEQRRSVVQLEGRAPHDARMIARHERAGDVRLDAGPRQLARGEQLEAGGRAGWGGGPDVGRHADVRSQLAREEVWCTL